MINFNTSQIKESIYYYFKWVSFLKISAWFTLLVGFILWGFGYLWIELILKDPSSPLSFIPIPLEVCQLFQTIGIILFVVGLFIFTPIFIMFLISIRKFHKLLRPNSIDALSPLLDDKDWRIRKEAVMNIITHCSDNDFKRAIPYLENALNDTNNDVREEAEGRLYVIKQRFKNNKNKKN